MPHYPPASVREAARSGLELRASLPPSRRCCTSVGLARARQLANGQPVSDRTLQRMRSYFARHAVDAGGRGWGVDSKGWQAWLLWGGDAGRAWSDAARRRRNPVDEIAATRQDQAAAADGFPWAVVLPDGSRDGWSDTRAEAAGRANRVGGRVYRVSGAKARRLGK